MPGKLSQPSGTEGDMITKCNLVTWVGSWKKKRTLGENWRNLNEVWTS